MKFKLMTAVCCVAAFSPALAAYDTWGQVQDVTAEGMPNYVWFKIAGMPSGCTGFFSYASENPESVQAVYAMLLESTLSEGSVWVQYDPNSVCRATAVHGIQVPNPGITPDDRKNRIARYVITNILKLLLL